MQAEMTEKTYDLFKKALAANQKSFDAFRIALKAALADILPGFASATPEEQGEAWAWAKREMRRTLPERGWTPRVLNRYIATVEVALQTAMPMDLVRTATLADLVATVAEVGTDAKAAEYRAGYERVREAKRLERKERRKQAATLFRLPDPVADLDTPAHFRVACGIIADYFGSPGMAARSKGRGPVPIAMRQIRKLMRGYAEAPK